MKSYFRGYMLLDTTSAKPKSKFENSTNNIISYHKSGISSLRTFIKLIKANIQD